MRICPQCSLTGAFETCPECGLALVEEEALRIGALTAPPEESEVVARARDPFEPNFVLELLESRRIPVLLRPDGAYVVPKARATEARMLIETFRRELQESERDPRAEAALLEAALAEVQEGPLEASLSQIHWRGPGHELSARLTARSLAEDLPGVTVRVRARPVLTFLVRSEAEGPSRRILPLEAAGGITFDLPPLGPRGFDAPIALLTTRKAPGPFGEEGADIFLRWRLEARFSQAPRAWLETAALPGPSAPWPHLALPAPLSLRPPGGGAPQGHLTLTGFEDGELKGLLGSTRRGEDRCRLVLGWEVHQRGRLLGQGALVQATLATRQGPAQPFAVRYPDSAPRPFEWGEVRVVLTLGIEIDRDGERVRGLARLMAG
ncbi:MAG: hypothetical protein D6729_07445 [Deltaproteobacteria bacterium]|nr:MAG: hypothetical protein D6729_07445 [Deltaproteobacteria bacterium]